LGAYVAPRNDLTGPQPRSQSSNVAFRDPWAWSGLERAADKPKQEQATAQGQNGPR